MNSTTAQIPRGGFPSPLVTGFMALYYLLMKKADFFEAGPVDPPRIGTDPDILRTLRRQIQAGSKQLPKPYHRDYISPLLANLSQIMADPIPELSKEHSGGVILPGQRIFPLFRLMAILNSGIQPAVTNGVAPALRQLQAVVSDMYDSFVRSRERLGIEPPLEQPIPPLTAFVPPIPGAFLSLQTDVPPWPLMIEIDQMQKFSEGFKTGVVSLPSGFRSHPLLWGVLAHEVGGHDVLHADEKLIPELEGIVQTKLKQKYPDVICQLWHYWFEESAAEVCGALNIGPAYGIIAFIVQTVLAPLVARYFDSEDLTTSADTLAARLPIKARPRIPNSDILDTHPIPVLIPELIIGTVRSLTKLEKDTLGRYLNQLEELVSVCSPRTDIVDFAQLKIPGNVKPVPNQPLGRLRESARDFAEVIVTSKLKALSGKYGLQDLETWDDDDEQASKDAANALLEQKSFEKKKTPDLSHVDDAQLLAGGVLAGLRQPQQYDRINEGLRNALELSYKADRLIHSRTSPKQKGVKK